MPIDPVVTLDIGVDGIAIASLNRPQQRNPINHQTAAALQAAIAQAADADHVRVLILRGNGPSFCGGGDIAAMAAHLADLPQFLGELIDHFHAVILALRRLPLPVIASVQGVAAGGGFSLAMACDLVVATRSARFVVAYPKLATSSDGGLSQCLTRRLGAGRALELLLLDDVVGAEEAHRLGLVTRLAPDAHLEETSMTLARQLAAVPGRSLREFKTLVAGVDLGELERQLAQEKAAFMRCAGTAELQERIRAFIGKQRPA